MFKAILNLILSYFLFLSDEEPLPSQNLTVNSFFQLSAKDLQTGNQIKFSKYAYKKAIIIVNVACQCGYTKDHYTQLMKIYRKYKKQGLQILAFPCNQFSNQQNGTSAQIFTFVVDSFQVSFPIFEKILVNGPNTHQVYLYLKRNSELYDQITKKAKQIPWNFNKFILNKSGKVIGFFPPTTEMNIIQDVVKNLLLQNEDL